MDCSQPSSRLRRKKKKGHTSCNNCGTVYNNNSVPSTCSCGHYLGGKGTSNLKHSVVGAFLITAALASVRSKEKGNSNRIFVALGHDKKVNL